MKIEFNDEEIKLLLETLGQFHIIKFIKGESNYDYEKLIESISTQLIINGKKHIFDSVFNEVKR